MDMSPSSLSTPPIPRLLLLANVVERVVQLEEFLDDVAVCDLVTTRRRVRDLLDEFDLK